MDKELSQIILYVDIDTRKEDICTFCTNISELCDKIQCTCICYVNETEINVIESLLAAEENTENIFVISDSDAILHECINRIPKLAYAYLLTDKNRDKDICGIKYAIEDIANISYEQIERMWNRYRDIPWIIAQTDRLIIREQTVEDLSRIYEVYNDSEVAEYMSPLYADISDEACRMKEYIKHQYGFYEFGIWALIEKNTGEIIGRAGISQGTDSNELELGYVIAREYRRKGYALEACKKVLEYMKDEFEMESIFASVRQDNIASVNLLTKLGFVKSNEYIKKSLKYNLYILTLS